MLRLLYGDDRVSMDAAVAKMTTQGGESAAVMNVLRFDAASADLTEIAVAARSLPFFGGTRVIVVRGLGERLKAVAKDDRTALVAALEDLPPSTDLLVVEPDLHEKPESHPLHDVARRKGEVLPFRVAAVGNVEEWLAKQAQALGVTITPPAAAELHRRVGAGAVVLRSELEKLASYALDSGAIRPEDVRELVTPSPETNVFDLVEAIGKRNPSVAARQLEDLLLRRSESTQGLLAMVARQFRQLIVAKDAMERHAGQADLARELGAPSWLVRRLVAQSRLFTVTELEQALEAVLAADCTLKGGADLSEASVLTRLVVDLTAG